MSYFAKPDTAERYARHRPFFHPLAVERIQAACGLATPVARALDVACGAGQSARALTTIARQIIATDISHGMLAQADAHPRITYVRSAAETMPFAASAFDLLTASLAFHWFQQRQFLDEAARVLKPDGWLALYNHHFSGEMVGNPDYAVWNKEDYARRYPAPPRNSAPLTNEKARRHGFVRVSHETFKHTVAFAPNQLVGYLLTHSNVVAAAEYGGEDIQAIADWLLDSVRPLFRAEAADFPFRGVVDVFRREQP